MSPEIALDDLRVSMPANLPVGHMLACDVERPGFILWRQREPGGRAFTIPYDLRDACGCRIDFQRQVVWRGFIQEGAFGAQRQYRPSTHIERERIEWGEAGDALAASDAFVSPEVYPFTFWEVYFPLDRLTYLAEDGSDEQARPQHVLVIDLGCGGVVGEFQHERAQHRRALRVR